MRRGQRTVRPDITKDRHTCLFSIKVAQKYRIKYKDRLILCVLQLELERFQSATVTFKVIQGHWQWCHSIGHIRFPVSVATMSLSCAANEILSLVSQNLRRSRDSKHPPFMGNLSCMH